MKPAEYWRKSKQWSQYFLKTGTVIQATQVFVAPRAQAAYAPYSFLLVDVLGEKIEVMGVPGQEFSSGDTVRLVLRRVGTHTPSEPIPYGLKAEKIIL